MSLGLGRRPESILPKSSALPAYWALPLPESLRTLERDLLRGLSSCLMGAVAPIACFSYDKIFQRLSIVRDSAPAGAA